MRSWSLRILAVATLVVASDLRGQELAVFGAAATPGVYRDQTFGAGASAAAFIRLGSISADGESLHASQLRIGLRLGYTEYRASQHREYRCFGLGTCVPDPHEVQSRMGMTNLQLAIASRWNSATRLELAAGIATYTFRDEWAPSRHGLTGSFALSRRLLAGQPWWASLDYTLHGRNAGTVLMDATNFSPPDHSLKAGIAYRFR